MRRSEAMRHGCAYRKAFSARAKHRRLRTEVKNPNGMWDDESLSPKNECPSYSLMLNWDPDENITRGRGVAGGDWKSIRNRYEIVLQGRQATPCLSASLR